MAAVQTLELRWHFPHDIDSGSHGVLSGKDTDRPAPVVSLHWHPLEFKLLTSGFDGSAKIWCFDPLASLGESIRHHSTMFLHERSSCNCARWSPDGKTIAASYNSGEVVLWRKVAERGTEGPNEAQPEYAVNRPSRPGAQHQWIYEFNVETWSATKVFRDFGETEVYAVCFSSDGRLLASGSQEGHFVVHDLENGYRKLRVDHKHVGPVQGIAWDPIGTYFATLGADRKCYVYGVMRAEGRPAAIHVHDTITRSEQGGWLFRGQDASQFYRHASFAPDGLMLAVPCGWFSAQEHFKGPKAGQPKYSHYPNHCAYVFLRHIFQRPYRALCISGDAPVIGAVFSPRIYQVKDTKPVWGPQQYVLAVAVFSIDVVTIFASTSEPPILQFTDIHLAPVTGVSWCKDGKHLAISSDDGACTLAAIGDVLHAVEEADIPEDAPALQKAFVASRRCVRQAQPEAEVAPAPPKVTTCIPVRRKADVVSLVSQQGGAAEGCG